MMLFGALLILCFLASLYIIFKFTWGKEGKNERGQKILNKAYMSSAPIMPIGWLLLEIAHDFSGISYEFYRDSMWVLVLLTFIVQGITIYLYKRNMLTLA